MPFLSAEFKRRAAALKPKCLFRVELLEHPQMRPDLAEAWVVTINERGRPIDEPQHPASSSYGVPTSGPVRFCAADLEWCLDRALAHAEERPAWQPPRNPEVRK